MPHLIVGPVTHESATLWVRGGCWRRNARLSLRASGEERCREVRLAREHDFTGTATIAGLRPATTYHIEARFGAFAGARSERVTGRVRTFPAPDSRAPFSFLHASCNLSVVSLTQAAAVAAIALGALAGLHLLRRPRPSTAHEVSAPAPDLPNARAAAGRDGRAGAAAFAAGSSRVVRLFEILYELTAGWQPEPLLPSPFAPLRRIAAQTEPPAFMIHAGDQIYFDFPLPGREPTLGAYRRAYRQALFGDPVQREFLTQMPHYMTLDDHEFVDGFARDFVPRPDRDPESYFAPALRAYDEYVGSRQTPDAGARHRGYAFDHGVARFLVLDTRTQRSRSEKRMLDSSQIEWLLGWLEKCRDQIKFVVTSVPFLAQLAETPAALAEGGDKWTGGFFRSQRDRILDFVHERRIERLVFLTGDMHCTYHATMELGSPLRRILLHELAGGPIHQAQYADRDDFRDETFGSTGHGRVPFRTFLRAFSASAASVLQVSVSPGDRPEIRWRIVPTGAPGIGPSRPAGLAGRIDF